jgi:phage protein D
VSARSVYESGLPPTAYYAPDYRIEVEGAELDPASKGDILEVKVVMDIDNLTSFELNVNNWDDRTFFFKYSDKPEDPKTVTYDLNARVDVLMGYVDRLLPMVSGTIRTLAPKFPDSGPPTIQISGLDHMSKLKNRKPTEEDVKKFVDQDDAEIAGIIAERNGLKLQASSKGLIKHKLVIQKNQDDAQFLMERAKRIDFDCYVKVDMKTKVGTLHFENPRDGRTSKPTHVYAFEWGTNLIDFTPTITVKDQVKSVTVRCWDPASKSVIEYKADEKDLPKPKKSEGKSGPGVVEEGAGQQEVVVDAVALSEEEVKKLAISLLTERAYEFITGTGRVIGLPDLRPGEIVELNGLGKRFSGEYYVKKAEHTLNSNGYITQFDVRRLYEGGDK